MSFSCAAVLSPAGFQSPYFIATDRPLLAIPFRNWWSRHTPYYFGCVITSSALHRADSFYLIQSHQSLFFYLFTFHLLLFFFSDLIISAVTSGKYCLYFLFSGFGVSQRIVPRRAAQRFKLTRNRSCGCGSLFSCVRCFNGMDLDTDHSFCTDGSVATSLTWEGTLAPQNQSLSWFTHFHNPLREKLGPYWFLVFALPAVFVLCVAGACFAWRRCAALRKRRKREEFLLHWRERRRNAPPSAAGQKLLSPLTVDDGGRLLPVSYSRGASVGLEREAGGAAAPLQEDMALFDLEVRTAEDQLSHNDAPSHVPAVAPPPRDILFHSNKWIAPTGTAYPLGGPESTSRPPCSPPPPVPREGRYGAQFIASSYSLSLASSGRSPHPTPNPCACRSPSSVQSTPGSRSSPFPCRTQSPISHATVQQTARPMQASTDGAENMFPMGVSGLVAVPPCPMAGLVSIDPLSGSCLGCSTSSINNNEYRCANRYRHKNNNNQFISCTSSLPSSMHMEIIHIYAYLGLKNTKQEVALCYIIFIVEIDIIIFSLLFPFVVFLLMGLPPHSILRPLFEWYPHPHPSRKTSIKRPVSFVLGFLPTLLSIHLILFFYVYLSFHNLNTVVTLGNGYFALCFIIIIIFFLIFIFSFTLFIHTPSVLWDHRGCFLHARNIFLSRNLNTSWLLAIVIFNLVLCLPVLRLLFWRLGVFFNSFAFSADHRIARCITVKCYKRRSSSAPGGLVANLQYGSLRHTSMEAAPSGSVVRRIRHDTFTGAVWTNNFGQTPPQRILPEQPAHSFPAPASPPPLLPSRAGANATAARAACCGGAGVYPAAVPVTSSSSFALLSPTPRGWNPKAQGCPPHATPWPPRGPPTLIPPLGPARCSPAAALDRALPVLPAQRRDSAVWGPSDTLAGTPPSDEVIGPACSRSGAWSTIILWLKKP
eukprot:gene2061-1247_t